MEYWLVTDFLTLGSVHNYIGAEELSWGQMLRIVIGMARGLSYLHTEVPRSSIFCGKPSIAHRDFKSRNVLLKSDLTACISDMGLAILLESGQGIGDAHLQVRTQYVIIGHSAGFTMVISIHADIIRLNVNK